MQTDNYSRYAGIDPCEICNGAGFGVTLFMQGCSRHCPGCHNPQTWDHCGGLAFDDEADQYLIDRYSKPYIRRLTISGGEPFENFDFLCNIAVRFKQRFPEKKLWIYTGFTWEELMRRIDDGDDMILFVLRRCDVLVDGCFMLDRRDITLPFRGSANQRIIDVQKSLKYCTAVDISNELE